MTKREERKQVESQTTVVISVAQRNGGLALLRLPFSRFHESVSRVATDARRYGATLVLNSTE